MNHPSQSAGAPKLVRGEAIVARVLEATIEELETSNEELQATNEELMSSNEELQSTNEELQSVNEELHTLNTEYQAKIAELKEILEKDPENTSRIQPASASLVESLQKVGSAVYGAQQAASGNGAYQEEPAGEAGASDEDEATVEGEFREV